MLQIPQLQKSQLEGKIETEFSKNSINNSAFDEIDSDSSDPLRLWNRQIEKLTSVNKVNDVKPAYLKLFSMLDVVCYKGMLQSDSTLIPKWNNEILI